MDVFTGAGRIELHHPLADTNTFAIERHRAEKALLVALHRQRVVSPHRTGRYAYLLSGSGRNTFETASEPVQVRRDLEEGLRQEATDKNRLHVEVERLAVGQLPVAVPFDDTERYGDLAGGADGHVANQRHLLQRRQPDNGNDRFVDDRLRLDQSIVVEAKRGAVGGRVVVRFGSFTSL